SARTRTRQARWDHRGIAFPGAGDCTDTRGVRRLGDTGYGRNPSRSDAAVSRALPDPGRGRRDPVDLRGRARDVLRLPRRGRQTAVLAGSGRPRVHHPHPDLGTDQTTHPQQRSTSRRFTMTDTGNRIIDANPELKDLGQYAYGWRDED